VLKVGGSASARDVADRLLEGFTAAEQGFAVEHLPSTHSGAALEALRQGELDLAYLTREPTVEERAGLYLYPIAKDPLVFAAHKGTGVLGLTTRQLRDLYSGATRTWSPVGGAELPVILLDRPAYTSPKRLLLAGPFGNLEIDADALVLEGPDLMDEALGAYPGALGYTSLRSALALGDRVDVLRFNGVYPDMDSLRSGAYPIARNLIFAARDEFPFGAKKFVDYAASEEGRRVVELAAMVPLRREVLVAVPPMRNIVAIEVKYGGLARYLQKRLGRPVDLVHQPSYTDLVEAFRKNRVDAAFLGSFSYLLARLEAGVEVLARPEYAGVSHYRGVIYVRADSGYRRVEDLQGARVAHSGKATTAGYIFPLHYLKSRGLPLPGDFFGEFFEAGSHEAALRAVLHGRADAAAAKDLVFEEMSLEDPSMRDRLRAIGASLPVPSNGFAAGTLMDSELRTQIRGLLLSMDQSPHGRKALRDMGAERFVPTSDSDYANLYDMVEAVSDELTDFFQYR
jgi:phosphonate transport system substrate-binding protein